MREILLPPSFYVNGPADQPESKGFRMGQQFRSFIFPFLLFGIISAQQQPAPRQPYDIPLAKISISFDNSTNGSLKVKITYVDSDDQVVITNYDDMYIKYTHTGTERTVYKEIPERSMMVSEFESKHLKKVTKTLVDALEIFEQDLRDQNWSKCLYLDGFLPRFLKGYYYLFSAVQNSNDALPEEALVADSLYEISLNSLLSDKRINTWKTTHEYDVKLRIASKEFVFQLKQWLKKDSKSENLVISKELKDAYVLFINIYFNINTAKN